MRTVLIVKGDIAAAEEIQGFLAAMCPFAQIAQVFPGAAVDCMQAQPSTNLVIYTLDQINAHICRQIEEIRASSKRARILLYTNLETNPDDLRRCLAVGVSGVLSRRASNIDHHLAIEAMIRGDSFMDKITRMQMFTTV